LDKFSVLIFNATRPTAVGGVKRFSEELERCIKAKEPSTYQLFGSKQEGLVKGFVSLLIEFMRTLRKVDIVHFIVLSPYNMPFIILAKLRRKKVVSSYHGLYSGEVSMFISHWIADKVSRALSDAIISSSVYLKKALRLDKKVVIIRYPSEIKYTSKRRSEEFRLNSSGIVFVTATNFNIRKKSEAIHILLEAAKDFVCQYGNVRFLIFGDGKDLVKFKSKYGNRRNISFMGFRTDFLDFLSTSDAYIHISGVDNQPYSVIDALMQGKVVVCNDLEALKEMIDSEDNCIVPLQPGAIKMALQSLAELIVKDPGGFQARGERNRLLAIERYSADVIAKEYFALYRKISCVTGEEIQGG
jgi:glycosyltransferase involved in cell wall biosynthesis